MPGPVVLDGEAVALRTIEREDMAFVQDAKNDSQIWRPTGWPWPANELQNEAFFEETLSAEDGIHLLLTAASTPVGMVSFHTLSGRGRERRGEVGYWVAPTEQGQGYGKEGVSLLVDYGFEERGLHRIEAKVFEFNEASRSLLETLGFTQEGVHRDSAFADGEFHDTYWYGLLVDEWERST